MPTKSKCRMTKKYKKCISRSLGRSKTHNNAKKSCDAKLCNKKVSSSLDDLNKCKKTARYERCVMAIKEKNKTPRSSPKGPYNPWAICNVSVCNYRSKSRKRSR